MTRSTTSPSGTHRILRFLLPIGAVLLALSATALAGEGFIRYRERHRPTPPSSMPTMFYRQGRLGYALVRNYDYFGWIHINAQGFRGADVSVAPAPGVLRIMAVGGSTTFDSFVSGDSHAWPARLEVWLRKLAPGKTIEVINAGVPGYRNVDNLIRLETELYQFRPTVIILYEVHNDLFSVIRQGAVPRSYDGDTPGEVASVTPWVHWLTRHSLLYTKVLDRWQVLRFGAAGKRAAGAKADSDWSATLERGSDAFERDLTLFVTAAQTLGIRVVLPEVLQVSGAGATSEPDPEVAEVWQLSIPWAPTAVVLDGYARFNAAAQRVAKRTGSTFIPTAGFGLRGTGWYVYKDPIHFNDLGADRMAEKLAYALVANGVLGR